MWLFTPPTIRQPMGDTGLWGRYTLPVGVSVAFMLDGSVKQFTLVDTEGVAGVEEWFQGGRVHTVDESTADRLTLAGYGPFLTPVDDAGGVVGGGDDNDDGIDRE